MRSAVMLRSVFRRLWEKIKRLWKLAKSERASPREIGWAVAIGAFAGCTPAVGVHGRLAMASRRSPGRTGSSRGSGTHLELGDAPLHRARGGAGLASPPDRRVGRHRHATTRSIRRRTFSSTGASDTFPVGFVIGRREGLRLWVAPRGGTRASRACRHRRIIAQLRRPTPAEASATVFGIACVRLSGEPSVTRMSSSMRTPMPRHSAATLSSSLPM